MNTDCINNVTQFLETKDIINLYCSKLFLLTDKQLLLILNDKLGIDVSKYNLSKIERISSTTHLFKLLNFLARLYGTSDGKNNLSTLSNIVKFNPDFVETQARLKIRYREIILQYRGRNHDKTYVDNENDNNFGEWYNIRGYCKLPSLDTKPYIVVTHVAREVLISSKMKGSSITVDDILFASRALVRHDSKIISGMYDNTFTILQDQNDILIINVTIKNRRNELFEGI